MSRHHSRTRISRPLIAALGVTMVIGGGAYLHKQSKAHAQAERERMSLKAVEPDVLDVKPTAQALAVNAPPPTIPLTALVTQTPGSAPADPARNPLAASTTQPAKPKVVPVPSPVVPAPVLAAAVFSPNFLGDAKAKMDAGDLLDARRILNDALLSGHASAADADTTRRLISEINQSAIFSRKFLKDDPFVTRYQVQSGERLARIADKHDVTWELLCRINGLADARKVRAGQWIKIPNGPFHCVITKSAFRLDVYLGSPGEAGSLFVTSLAVGLGKDNSTPTGMWMIQQGSKAHPATYYSPRGEGVMAADDPKNPLGGYWMGLSGVAGNAVDKNSYGIHGTIEPDSIGKQASMGCIRLGHEDISFLYDLLVDGKSKVVVKD